MRKLLLSLMLAMTLAIGSAATAVAAPPPGTYQDTVVGIETAVPTGPSMFAGYASGQLPGFWAASVFHGPLPTKTSTPGTITGGSFRLTSWAGVVSGSFDNAGTITLVRGTCTQTFLVHDTLTLANGTGTFDAYLTHYGFGVAGNCHIFFATIHGPDLVTLTLKS